MPSETANLDLNDPAARQMLAEETVTRHYAANPQLAVRYGPKGRAKCVEDARYHLAYLDEALASGAPPLFLAYVDWVRSLLQGLGVPDADLRAQLAVLRDLTLLRLAQPGSAEAAAILDLALAV